MQIVQFAKGKRFHATQERYRVEFGGAPIARIGQISARLKDRKRTSSGGVHRKSPETAEPRPKQARE